MKILVTGTDGYIGSLLGPRLAQAGHDVVGLDTGYYREGWLYTDCREQSCIPTTLVKDLRHIVAEDVAGCDAVVHLAELSNDPLGENNPEVTHQINHHGSVRLAKLARDAGARRFVYTSSCSVYGAGEGTLDETSPTRPLTAYAECKTLVERDVAKLATENFSPVFLRNATAYGASPRMRFDIVINNLAGVAWTTREIKMTSDGTPWRPLVHVLDICQAIECCIDAPREAVHNETFNVGHDGDNYQIREIAAIIGDVFPGCNVSIGSSAGDNRSYRVNFEKITNGLPGFKCEWTARQGAEQLRNLFERIDLDRATFEGRGHTRLKMLQHLIETRQLDDEFYWRPLEVQ